MWTKSKSVGVSRSLAFFDWQARWHDIYACQSPIHVTVEAKVIDEHKQWKRDDSVF